VRSTTLIKATRKERYAYKKLNIKFYIKDLNPATVFDYCTRNPQENYKDENMDIEVSEHDFEIEQTSM